MLTVTNICRHAAREIRYLPDNTVLISINETICEYYPLSLDRNSSKVFTCKFDDVCEPRFIDNKIRTPINAKTTLKLIGFIERNRDKNFIIHCAAGIARSAAVAMYIHLTYGHRLKESFWLLSRPNPFVLGRLFIEKHRKGLPDEFK